MTTSNANENDDKINILMNKINTLENGFKEERRIRFKLEEELKNYNLITIPNFQKQLEEKESLLKTTFIEKVKIEKEFLELAKNVNIFYNP